MVGNVTSVSLLETVGAPAPQTGAGNAPGKNFAAVLQQAGNEAGTSLPGSPSSVNGPQEKEQNAEQDGAQGASSAKGTPSAQSDALKADTPSVTGRPGQSARKASTGPQTSIQFTKWSGSGTVQNVLSPVSVTSQENTAAVWADSAVTTPMVSVEENASAVATPGVLVGETTAPVDLAVVLNTAGAANGVSQGNGKGAVALQPGSVQKKSGKETVSLESKPAAKPADVKVDSKLTAAIPQGTAVVPQSDAAASGLNATAALVAPVLAVPAEAVSGKTKDVGEPLATGATGLPSALGRTVFPQTTNSSQSDGAVSGSALLPGASVEATPSTGAASTRGFEQVMAQAVGTPVPAKSRANAFAGSVPQDAESERAEAATVATDVTPASPAQGQPVLKEGNPNIAGTDAQPLVAGTVASSAGVVMQAVSTSTKVASSVKSAGNAASEAVAPGTPQAQTVPSSSTARTAAAPVAKPSTLPAVAAVADRALTAKTSDATPLPIHGSTPQTKTSSSPLDSSVTQTVSKEAVAPPLAASVQPAVSPVDHSGVATTVAIPVVQANSLPHIQTTVPSAFAGGGLTEGVSVGGQAGTASGASLPHTTLSATPTSLEVGVSSGTHGWLKIRAELNAAGEVNASLTGASAAATEKLRSDLPALSSYLQAEKVSMGVLDVRSALHTASASFENGSTFSQTGSGQQGSGHTGQGGAQGAAVSTDTGASGGRAQQQAQQGGDTSPALRGVQGANLGEDKVLLGRISDAAVYGIHTELGGSELSPSLGYGAGGGWLNVRA